jgi:molybdenum cofactor cytidylyltransferase
VLAAGASSRFGSDKLLHPFNGKPLAAHIADTLAAIDAGHRIALCPSGATERATLFTDRGFEIVGNPHPDRGLSSSLALAATRATELGAGALLICLADMPNVTAAHLLALIAAAANNEIIATRAGNLRCPPAIFGRSALPLLLDLSGDQGARHLLRTAASIEVPPQMARDVDTPADFD